MRFLLLCLISTFLSAESIIRLDGNVLKAPILKFKEGHLFIREGETHQRTLINSISFKEGDIPENYSSPIIRKIESTEIPESVKVQLEQTYPEAEKFAKLFPDEPAVFHSQHTTFTFKNSGERKITREFSFYVKDISILKEEVISLPYNYGVQSIESLEAYIKQPSGKICRIDDIASFSSLKNSLAKQAVVTTFPVKAKVGSLILVKSVIKDNCPVNKVIQGDHNFRPSLPVFSSRLQVVIPGKIDLFHEAVNISEAEAIPEIKLDLDNGTKSFTWELSRPGAINGTTSIPHIYFTTAPNWNYIASLYRPHLNNLCSYNDAIKKLGEAVASKKKGTAKVAALYHWIQRNISLEPYDDTRDFIKSAEQVLATHSGNQLERAILLCTILNSTDMKAELAFTIDNNIPPDISLPLDALNKSFCFVPLKEKYVYLDCGENDISASYTDGTLTEIKTLHINSGICAVTPSSARNYSGSTVTAKITIDESGEIKCDRKDNFFGRDEQALRQKLRSVPLKERETTVRYSPFYRRTDMTKAEVSDPDNLDKQLQVQTLYQHQLPAVAYENKRFIQLPELFTDDQIQPFSYRKVVLEISYPEKWIAPKEKKIQLGSPEGNSYYSRTYKISENDTIMISQEYRLQKIKPSDQTVKMIRRLSRKPLIFKVD